MRLKLEHTEEVSEINLDNYYSPEIYSLIEEQYNAGNRYFICGIATEEGLAFALNVLLLQSRGKKTHLLNLTRRECSTKIESDLFNYIAHNADGTMITSQRYYEKAFGAPNCDFINDFKMTALNDGLCYSLVNTKSISPSFMDLFDEENEDSVLNK